MLETSGREIDRAGFRAKTTEAINSMIGCLFGEAPKNCKNCDNVDPCRFVVEAIFAYRCKEAARSPVT